MKILLILLLVIITAGCENDDKTISVGRCPRPETVEHFPWVMNLIDNLGECGDCLTVVVRARYRAEAVVFSIMSDSVCDGIFTGPIYNCKGRIVEYISGSKESQDKFNRDIVDRVTLGQCRN
jgi:hypothetical protein